MRRFLALFLSAFTLVAQQPSLPGPGPIAGTIANPPIFVAYTFVAQTSCGSTCSSITSPALTLNTGDLVFIFCRNGTNVASNPMTITSTPANTINALTSNILANNIHTSSAYISPAISGSTTFTCTPSTAAILVDMIVLQYLPGFLGVTLDTQVPASSFGAPVVTLTSNTFSTTAKGLIIFCGSFSNASLTFTANFIASTTATLRGFSAASNSADSACEDVITTHSASSTTANIIVNSPFKAEGGAAAFK